MKRLFFDVGVFGASWGEVALAYALYYKCKKNLKLMQGIKKYLSVYFQGVEELRFQQDIDTGGLMCFLSLADIARKEFKPSSNLLEKIFLISLYRITDSLYGVNSGFGSHPNEVISFQSPYGKWRTFTGFGAYLSYLRDHYNTR